ncbi:hypothetical protein [Cohnella caldifontis]|uniref:hypothetical protein n=1 Tax=Cohnella caldifontis TaxID=3027471 RepID=UPI0023ED7AA5|nr:hypothetical protein [Cohnella sp. YIM B05605]
MKRIHKPFGVSSLCLATLCLAALCLIPIQSPAAAEGRAPTPKVLWSGALSSPSPHTPAWIGYRLLESRKRMLGLRNPREDMIVADISDLPDGGTRVFYQRYVFRTPVWGDGLSVEIDRQGVIRRVTGRMHADLLSDLFHRPKRPALSADRAAAAAARWLESEGLAAEIGGVTSFYLPDRPGIPLVYAVNVGENGRLFVHAQTGRVIRADI